VSIQRDAWDLIACGISTDCGPISPVMSFFLQEESSRGRKMVYSNQDLKLKPISLKRTGR
jgi:hypothetical protein